MRCVELAWVVFLFAFIAAEKIPNNYGPYEIIWDKLEVCKGPKSTNCGNYEITNFVNASNVHYFMDTPKDCPITVAKISASTKTNNSTKKFLNYAVNKPCEHFVLAPFLTESFNFNLRNCRIMKGRYDRHYDFYTKAKLFLGSSFFYGRYMFHLIISNKSDNVICLKAEIEIARIS